MGRSKKPTVRSPSVSSELTVSSKEIPSGKQRHIRSIKERLNTALTANSVQADQIKVMTEEIESLKRFVNSSVNKPADTEIIDIDEDEDIRPQVNLNNSAQQIHTQAVVHQTSSTQGTVNTAMLASAGKKRKLTNSQPGASGQAEQPEQQSPNTINAISSSSIMLQSNAEKQSTVFKLKKIPVVSPLNTVRTSSTPTTQSQSSNLTSSSNQQTANKQLQSGPNMTQSIKEILPPPIKVSELNVKATTEILEQILGHKKFTFHRASPTDTFIRTTCKADHKAILEVLRNSDISGHSFTPKDEKKTSILLRNVCSSYNAEDISNGIADYGIDVKVSNIDSFVTERSNRSNRNLNIWRITLEPGSDVNALLSKKFINQLSGIRYERMRSNGLTQCHNCQDFGHVASNCFRNFRCVKCHLTHDQGKCPTDNRTDESAPRPNPACVNCGKTGHPANYRGCEVHQVLLKRLNAKKKHSAKPRRLDKHTITTSVSQTSHTPKPWAHVQQRLTCIRDQAIRSAPTTT